MGVAYIYKYQKEGSVNSEPPVRMPDPPALTPGRASSAKGYAPEVSECSCRAAKLEYQNIEISSSFLLHGHGWWVGVWVGKCGGREGKF